MSYFRSPKTMHERRANQHARYDPLIRPQRGSSSLPTDWDDLHNGSRKDRNWKRFRRTKYRQSD